MTGLGIHDLYFELMALYKEGPYVSRCSVFRRALDEDLISKETFNAAREYYGKLWEYTGD